MFGSDNNQDVNRLVRPFPDRRQLLKQTALGFGFVALADLLVASNPVQAANRSGYPLTEPHHKPRAKRVIFLFMKGGPSHVDTFDPKPELDKHHGKPFPGEKPRVQFAATGNLLKSPWKFKKYGESGTQVSELFPNVAKHVDELCFVHSMYGTNPAHGGALLKLHTGSDNFVRPSMGAWVAYGLGSENKSLPAFITICPTLAHGGVNNWGSAFLPATCQGVPIGNAGIPVEQAKVKHIDPFLSSDVQRKQLDLLNKINQKHLEQLGPNRDLEGRIDSFELAFRMQSTMPEVEDISQETKETHALYGLDDPVTAPFGRQCLLARRFAEAGVRFVQVTHSDAMVQWDQHGDLQKGHTKNAKEVDKPIAALLEDLKRRGLLEDTLVVWGGEFGRTPTVQGASNDGRDHNPEGFTIWMAGGGVKKGFHYGATDDFGYYAQENKFHVHDFHATLLHILGLDHEKLTYRHAGRDFRLTDVEGHVAKEIFA